jgi:hypothetical protein
MAPGIVSRNGDGGRQNSCRRSNALISPTALRVCRQCLSPPPNAGQRLGVAESIVIANQPTSRLQSECVRTRTMVLKLRGLPCSRILCSRKKCVHFALDLYSQCVESCMGVRIRIARSWGEKDKSCALLVVQRVPHIPNGFLQPEDHVGPGLLGPKSFGLARLSRIVWDCWCNKAE